MVARVLLVWVFLWGWAGSARATTCEFDEASGVVTLTHDGGSGTLKVISGAISFVGVPCGSATVTNTARIVILDVGGIGYLTLQGSFAPGRNDVPEADEPEIEIDASAFRGFLNVKGSAAAEDWRFTAGGINLNGDLDEDVTFPTASPLPAVDLFIEPLAGADRIDAGAYTGPCRLQLSGGPGGDVIFGSPGADDIDGDDGNDILYGRAGNDSIDGGYGNNLIRGGSGDDWFAAGDDTDDFRGGAGFDYVAYGGSPVGVTVTLDDVADDGQPGEGDNVHVDVEGVYGSDHDDVLVGSTAANSLHGEDGNDEIYGGDGDDYLSGWYGDDFLLGEGGNDWLTGLNGNNVLDGGPGVDSYRAGYGDDILLNADGKAETVDCGAGIDDAEPSAIDTFIGCENI